MSHFWYTLITYGVDHFWYIADGVNHGPWCESFLVYPITHGVDHFWCTPLLIGWTTVGGAVVYAITPWVDKPFLVYAIVGGVDHMSHAPKMVHPIRHGPPMSDGLHKSRATNEGRGVVGNRRKIPTVILCRDFYARCRINCGTVGGVCFPLHAWRLLEWFAGARIDQC